MFTLRSAKSAIIIIAFSLTGCGQDSLKERAERGDPKAQYELAISLPPESHQERDRLMMLSAAQAHAEAQYEVGLAYLTRRSREPNSLAKSVFWLRKAAERGDPRSQDKLVEIHLGLHGGTLNIEAAFQSLSEDGANLAPEACILLHKEANARRLAPEWQAKTLALLESAAETGHPEACLELALQLRKKRGTAELDKRIFSLLKLAADKDNLSAMHEAGSMMLEGKGTPKAPLEGARLMLAAAEKNHGPAACAVFRLLAEGRHLPKNPRKAHELVVKAAEQGLGEAARLVAECHGRGIGVTQNEFAAIEWLKRAAKAGDMEAMMALGEIYISGAGNQQRSPIEAMGYFQMAAKAGQVDAHYRLYEINAEIGDNLAAYKSLWEGIRLKDTRAMHRMGVVYEEGELGLAPNEQMALNYYLQGAELDDPVCMAFAGWMMVNGKTIRRNHEEGIRLLTEAHKSNILLAHFTLGVINLTGDGVDMDPEEAFFYANLAYLQAPNSDQFKGLVTESGKNLSSERKSRALERSRRWIAGESGGAGRAPAGIAGSTGSGIIFSKDGLVLTNHHVVDGGETFRVVAESGVEFDAEVIASDSELDVAVLRISGSFVAKGFPNPPPLGAAEPSKIGQRVFTIGHPLAGTLSSEPKYTDGTISALSGMADDKNLLQISVPIQPGNSGGPLANERGEVVGLIVASINSRAMLAKRGILPQNVNFAIKWEPISEFLSSNGVAVPREQAGGDPIERIKAYSVKVISSR